MVEAFFSALTGYLCWRIDGGAARFILPGAMVVGLAAGFRPSSLLLLGPLLLYSLRGAKRQQAAAGMGALAATLLAWFIPMIRIGGGKAYLSSLVSLWLAVPSRGTVVNSSGWNSLARAAAILGIYFLCFGCAAMLPFRARSGDSSSDPRKTIFTLVWIGPGLLFFTFIYLKFVNSGYLLALAPPACAWMGLWASTWYANLHLSRALKIAAMGACAAVNTMVFVCAPVYCSYGEVRRFEAELRNIIQVLPQIASPRETLIVGFDSHFLGYRHAGYYLPGYLTVQFPEVQLTSGKRVFAMKDRDTWLETGLPATSVHDFVMFPLPLGDSEYSNYMALVRRRFPSGELRTVMRGGHEFAIGPVAELGVLFPGAVGSQACVRRATTSTPLVNSR
jgi:hypothetical protein